MIQARPSTQFARPRCPSSGSATARACGAAGGSRSELRARPVTRAAPRCKPCALGAVAGKACAKAAVAGGLAAAHTVLARRAMVEPAVARHSPRHDAHPPHAAGPAARALGTLPELLLRLEATPSGLSSNQAEARRRAVPAA